MGKLQERTAAIFIGLIMLFSVGGWAIMSIVPQDTGPEYTISTIVTYELSNEEVIFVLQNGMVLIEYFYLHNSTDYINELPTLESFANQFEGFIVLEEVSGNVTRFDMIGLNGQIVNLEGIELNYDNLFETFCTIAIAQPPECLL